MARAATGTRAATRSGATARTTAAVGPARSPTGGPSAARGPATARCGVLVRSWRPTARSPSRPSTAGRTSATGGARRSGRGRQRTRRGGARCAGEMRWLLPCSAGVLAEGWARVRVEHAERGTTTLVDGPASCRMPAQAPARKETRVGYRGVGAAVSDQRLRARFGAGDPKARARGKVEADCGTRPVGARAATRTGDVRAGTEAPSPPGPRGGGSRASPPGPRGGGGRGRRRGRGGRGRDAGGARRGGGGRRGGGPPRAAPRAPPRAAPTARPAR